MGEISDMYSELESLQMKVLENSETESARNIPENSIYKERKSFYLNTSVPKDRDLLYAIISKAGEDEVQNYETEEEQRLF